MMQYVDVILPLPLEGVFTYSVPESLASQVRLGVRVLVPLGKSKTYTAMAVELHERKPQFATRDILQVIDQEPVLTERQMKLWQWIADYYMAPLGDVFKAALPAGLKAEENYRPKTVRCVTLPANLRSEQSLHLVLSILSKAYKQHETFNTYLQLSHWDEIDGERPPQHIQEIAYDELQNASGASDAVLRQLINRKYLEIYHREVGRLNHLGSAHPELIQQLSPAQQQAKDSVEGLFEEKNVVLLHGVTSSGKTEIYIHLIQKAIDEGKQVLYLLPEIALTVQMTDRLQRVFGNRLGIYHSKYSDAERVEIWKKQLSAEPYDVVLGARSAVFLPFSRLGLVIVDEEHETSFKQQDPAPRYHARNAALVLAAQMQARTLLGTATPSLETYRNALTGRYGLVRLTTRFRDVQLPDIQVVDVKEMRRKRLMSGPFSPQLIDLMRDALEHRRQVILFQNRRGFSPIVECHVCGWTPRCEKCDVSLTYHQRLRQMVCHYCGTPYQVPLQCPNCESKEIRHVGYGTERIEDQLAKVLPEARIARMDLDTTRSRMAYEQILQDFQQGKTDVLVGTQMVTKGLDFERVSVVGILDADGMLSQPDFRSHERAFQMMEQVAGRAGRKGGQGHVILQTRDAQSPVVQQVVAHDYQAMYEAQMQERELFNYPPLCRLVSVYVKHRDERTADALGRDMAQLARRTFGERVLGPDTPPIGRIQLMYIRKVLVKIELTASMSQARDYLRQIQRYLLALPQYKGAQVYYDVD